MEKTEKNDDELSFDISKVTRFFKKDRKEHHHAPAHAAETRTEAPVPTGKERSSSRWELARQTALKYSPFLLLLIPIFFSIFIRMQPVDFPLADSWAASTLDNALKQQMTTQVTQQYPNLPAANKDALIASQMQKFKEANRQEYDAQKNTLAEQLRDHFRDEQGYIYMPDIDPYFYLRYARNIVEKGTPGDIIKDGKPWDTHGLAPIGGVVTSQMPPYILAWIYRIMHLINPRITLMEAAKYAPIIFIALSIIPIFFIGRRMAGNFGGFIAGMMLAVHGALVNRTIFGHADNDAYNIFFSVFIFWLFIECYEQRDWRKKLALGVGAGILTGLFSWAWTGWWYVFDFTLAATGLYIAYLLIKKRKDLRQFHKDETVRNSAMSLGIFILSAGIFVSLISTIGTFLRAPLQPLNFLILKVAAKASLWPNVYTTVAELNEASLQSIIGVMGGMFLLGLAVLGLILLLIGKDKKDENWLYAFIIALWLGAMLYASTKGIRFTMLVVPPLALGFGITAGKIYHWASTLAARELHIHKAIMAVVCCIAFLLPLGITPIPPFCSQGMCGSSLAAAKGDIPIVNDAWYNALTKIKQDSRPDAIINSWWDFGHHFKYIADRAVTFDGGSQNRPQAHWIGKVLLTSDEDQAIAILRMLDCGANTAFDIVENHSGDTKRGVDTIYRLLGTDAKQGRALLKDSGMPDDKAQQVIDRVYCQPPEDYFITSDDMVGKGSVWAHFGSWNFERASIWINTRSKSQEEAIAFMKREFGYDDEQAERTYFEVQSLGSEGEANSWIAPWPAFVSNGGCASASNSSMRCQLNLGSQRIDIDIDLRTMEPVVENAKDKPTLTTIAYVDAKGFHQKWFNGTTLPYGLTIIRDDNGNVQALLMSPELTGSMFTRLYFFNGIGLKHFRLFDTENSFVGTKVYVWKLDWEGKEGKTQQASKTAAEGA